MILWTGPLSRLLKKDANEVVRRLPTFTHKAAAQEFSRNLEKLVGYKKASGGQTDPNLATWVESLPLKIKIKFTQWAILGGQQVAAAKPLLEHLEEYTHVLKAKGDDPKHVRQTITRIRRIIKGCEFRFWSDIKDSRVATFLSALKTTGEIGTKTFNCYLKHFKSFCQWMVTDRRAQENPITHLKPLNASTAPSRERRPLEVGEMQRLLEATKRASERFGMTGPERAMLYRVAVETGLRAGELRSLKRGSFELDRDPPTVTVVAAYSKHRRKDLIPLKKQTAALLRDFLANKAPRTKAFKVPGSDDTAEMLRTNLEDAGISHTDVMGRVVDFHALRHTTGSWLAARHTHPKVIQQIMRHSTITLTMDRYTHLFRNDETEALENLPELNIPGERVVATGTCGSEQSALASCLAPQDQSG